jgi:hypothetical protein
MALAQRRPANSIFVIAPYWLHGTWVFDDPSVGLVQEPFVAGVPEILDAMVAEVPGSRSGFKLLFSDAPFPGFHREFVRVRTEYGGTWYESVESAKSQGWLCPALFKYYPEAPERLYVRVERLSGLSIP